MDPQGVPMAKQLKSLGLDIKFVMGDGGFTPKLIELAGDAAEGVYASQPSLPLEQMPGGSNFSQRYMAKYQQPIQQYAPYCYDAVNVMIAAMQKQPQSNLKILIRAWKKLLMQVSAETSASRKWRCQRWLSNPLPSQTGKMATTTNHK